MGMTPEQWRALINSSDPRTGEEWQKERERLSAEAIRNDLPGFVARASADARKKAEKSARQAKIARKRLAKAERKREIENRRFLESQRVISQATMNVFRSEAKKRAAPWEGRGNHDRGY